MSRPAATYAQTRAPPQNHNAYGLEASDEPHVGDEDAQHHHAAAMSYEDAQQLEAEELEMAQHYGHADDHDVHMQGDGMTTVPNTPPQAASVPASVTSAPPATLWAAGLAAMKKNVLPGLALQAIAIFLIVLYYSSASAQASFDKLADLKARGGYAFSFIGTALFGYVCPQLIMLVKDEYERRKLAKTAALTAGLDMTAGHNQQVLDSTVVSIADLSLDSLSGQHGSAAGGSSSSSSPASVATSGAVTVKAVDSTQMAVAKVIYLIVWWGWRGVEVDIFYHIQSMIWGDDSKPGTIIAKVCTDQFFVTIVYFGWSCLAVFAFKDFNFSVARLVSMLRSRRFWLWEVPQLTVSGWIVWIPAVACVYIMPGPLQIPLFNLVLCFWSLILTLLTTKQE